MMVISANAVFDAVDEQELKAQLSALPSAGPAKRVGENYARTNGYIRLPGDV